MSRSSTNTKWFQKISIGRRLTAEALLSEAYRRLADAVKSKHFNEVPVAQGVLEIAHTMMKTIQVEMEAWPKRLASLECTRMEMIDNAKH